MIRSLNESRGPSPSRPYILCPWAQNVGLYSPLQDHGSWLVYEVALTSPCQVQTKLCNPPPLFHGMFSLMHGTMFSHTYDILLIRDTWSHAPRSYTLLMYMENRHLVAC